MAVETFQSFLRISPSRVIRNDCSISPSFSTILLIQVCSWFYWLCAYHIYIFQMWKSHVFSFLKLTFLHFSSIINTASGTFNFHLSSLLQAFAMIMNCDKFEYDLRELCHFFQQLMSSSNLKQIRNVTRSLKFVFFLSEISFQIFPLT